MHAVFLLRCHFLRLNIEILIFVRRFLAFPLYTPASDNKGTRHFFVERGRLHRRVVLRSDKLRWPYRSIYDHTLVLSVGVDTYGYL